MDTSHAEDQHKEYIGAELRRFGREAGEEKLQVVSPFEPAGDQPQAIEKLAQGIEDGLRYQTLLGVTGSGKTFSMAKAIEKLNRPTLIMEPNKTLAAQVASEMKELFPNNAVVYFVSYYDYYQPEAYVPQSDTYIEKDASINEEVEKLRHQATSSLLSRRDVIVVASVSCIYGIGSPQDYAGLAPNVDKSVPLERDDFIKDLIDVQYDRNDYDLQRGMFRVRGDVVDVFPPYAENPLRIEFFGDEVEIYNHRGRVRIKAYYDEEVQRGTLVTLGVWWQSQSSDPNVAINALTADRPTDQGWGSTFYDVQVHIKKADV